MVLKEKGQSTKQTCGQRASFEKRYRQAQYQKITYKVQGWRQSNLELWGVNQELKIEDKILGVNNTLLITNVIFTLDSGGMLTELKLIPSDGYKREGSRIEAKMGTSQTHTENKWKGVVK